MRLLLASATMLAVLTSACAESEQGGADVGQAGRSGATAVELVPGKAVFAKWCAPCHANVPSLAGTMSLAVKYADTDMPAALEDRTDLTGPVIETFVRTGVAWMPPFRKTEISDAELAQMTAYLTAPLDQRGAHAELLATEMVRLQQEQGQ